MGLLQHAMGGLLEAGIGDPALLIGQCEQGKGILGIPGQFARRQAVKGLVKNTGIVVLTDLRLERIEVVHRTTVARGFVEVA